MADMREQTTSLLGEATTKVDRVRDALTHLAKVVLLERAEQILKGEDLTPEQQAEWQELGATLLNIGGLSYKLLVETADLTGIQVNGHIPGTENLIAPSKDTTDRVLIPFSPTSLSPAANGNGHGNGVIHQSPTERKPDKRADVLKTATDMHKKILPGDMLTLARIADEQATCEIVDDRTLVVKHGDKQLRINFRSDRAIYLLNALGYYQGEDFTNPDILDTELAIGVDPKSYPKVLWQAQKDLERLNIEDLELFHKETNDGKVTCRLNLNFRFVDLRSDPTALPPSESAGKA